MMELQYKQEHVCCYNFKENSAQIEFVEQSARGTVDYTASLSLLIVLTRGSIVLSCGTLSEERIGRGRIMFFPPGSVIRIEAVEECEYMICHIDGTIQLCERMSLERLYHETEKIEKGFHTLPVNERIHDFTRFLGKTTRDGLKCTHYFNLKIKELFFLLRAYYTKEQLAELFLPLMGPDALFMFRVYNIYPLARNVKELAKLSNYSLSGFKKQFNKVFGIPPSEWISDRKAAGIFHDLNVSALTIKELTDKYAFSSSSAFSTFCQQKFGKPPGQIRKKGDKIKK